MGKNKTKKKSKLFRVEFDVSCARELGEHQGILDPRGIARMIMEPYTEKLAKLLAEKPKAKKGK